MSAEHPVCPRCHLSYYLTVAPQEASAARDHFKGEHFALPRAECARGQCKTDCVYCQPRLIKLHAPAARLATRQAKQYALFALAFCSVPKK